MPQDPTTAPYFKIAEKYRGLIEEGHYMPGGPFYTTEALAEAECVHRSTAYKALAVLRNEGYLYGTPKGTFVSQQSRFERLYDRLVDTLNELNDAGQGISLSTKGGKLKITGLLADVIFDTKEQRWIKRG
jgi:DNA-binding GntR family transcriptional regulator